MAVKWSLLVPGGLARGVCKLTRLKMSAVVTKKIGVSSVVKARSRNVKKVEVKERKDVKCQGHVLNQGGKAETYR